MRNDFNINKFPFKSMLNIIRYMANHPNTVSGVQQLQSASRACYSDTYEVTNMTLYLTSFGKIKKTESGWLITGQVIREVNKPYRIRYLETVLSVINRLNDHPKSATELAHISSLSTETIQDILQFMEQLTQYGYLYKSENGNGWKIAEYKQISNIMN